MSCDTHPIDPNDPCPCGSGLKWKKCCLTYKAMKKRYKAGAGGGGWTCDNCRGLTQQVNYFGSLSLCPTCFMLRTREFGEALSKKPDVEVDL